MSREAIERIAILASELADVANGILAANLNQSLVQQFISEQTYFVPGEKIPYSEFYSRFIEWLPPRERPIWTKYKVTHSLPADHPSGACTGNKRYIGNLSWTQKEPASGAKLWTVCNRRLVQK